MKKAIVGLCASFAVSVLLLAQGPASEYTLGADSQPQAGVPKGTLTKHRLAPGKIYPGVPHDYQVYVPAQYDPNKPTPLMVFMDGSGYAGDGTRVPVVFDNLIAKRELPPMIGIFVDPGVLPVFDESTQQNRYNRTFEYDEIDGRFARFLSEELIPEVGKTYNLSKDPSDRGLGGLSTGAVAAFVAAWHRPDQFRRVLLWIGTFVDMKGANTMPFLIRKTEPRPLRIFMQDGRADQNSGWGSWPEANQAMASALEFSAYDYRIVWGNEGHSRTHGSSILPDSLRWLWRDYPNAITVPAPVAVPARQGGPAQGRLGGPAEINLRPAAFTIVHYDRGWEQIGETYTSVASPAADKDGNVYFADPVSSRIYKSSADGRVTVFKDNTSGAKALKVGADRRIYASQPARKRIVSYGVGGDEKTVAENVDAYDLALTAKGGIYFTDALRRNVVMIDPSGTQKIAYGGGEILVPSALTLSPDQAMLDVMDARSKFGWSFQIAPDGMLISGQPFWRLEFSEQVDMTGIDGVTVDSTGYRYIPTVLGIEMSNQIGRVQQILNKPEPTVTITHVAFGGADTSWLYVATKEGKLYRRQLKRTGVPAWAPAKPPRPGL